MQKKPQPSWHKLLNDDEYMFGIEWIYHKYVKRKHQNYI